MSDTPFWRPPDGEEPLPDLTPMLDVLFMLLVFFLLTANSVEHALGVALPKKETGAARPIDSADRLRIALPPEPGTWRVGGETLFDWPAAKHAILDGGSGGPGLPVIIEGDRNTSLERVMQVFGFLSAEGFTQVDILMDRRPRDGTTKGSGK